MCNREPHTTIICFVPTRVSNTLQWFLQIQLLLPDRPAGIIVVVRIRIAWNTIVVVRTITVLVLSGSVWVVIPSSVVVVIVSIAVTVDVVDGEKASQRVG